LHILELVYFFSDDNFFYHSIPHYLPVMLFVSLPSTGSSELRFTPGKNCCLVAINQYDVANGLKQVVTVKDA